VKNNLSKEELLRKYLANECSPEELELVFDYLRSTQADSQLHAMLDAEVIETIHAPEKTDNALAEDMYPAIEQEIRRKPTPNQAKRTGRSWFTFPWRMAAVITAVILSAVVAYYTLNKENNFVLHTTAYGQTMSILLPDSSQVTLNGNSSIRYAQNWLPTEDREVWLTGEAFFSVKHTQAQQKFRVNTSDKFNVEVLGTEFNVYNRSTKTRVVLNSGKVTLNMQATAQQNRITMKPGELVEFKNNPSTYIKKGVNAEVYSSWINKKLILENTSFREIALLLEETYGLSVVVPDRSFYEERFSGIVPCENADMLLNALSLSFNLNIQKTGNKVKFQTK
jgi:ferric-dicitrate binding protein FerR (iron transport regulator)